VGGPPRSGTTLVQNILDTHPEICGGPEFDNIPNVVSLRNMMLESLRRGRTDVFMSKALLDDRIAEFVEGFLVPYAERRQRRLVSEKTPFNVLVFPELLELFPASRLVFCVRDPRAIAASMLKVGERAATKAQKFHAFTLSVDAAIAAIKQCFDKGFGVALDHRVFVAQYEELVGKPEQAMRRLCSFLGVPFDDAMLHPEQVKHEGDKTVDDMWYAKNEYYKAITAADADKWHDQLRPEDIQKINTAFAHDARLLRLGYDFTNAGLAPLAELAPQQANVPQRARHGPSTWPVIRYLWNIRR
jgi:hypothetical protein